MGSRITEEARLPADWWQQYSTCRALLDQLRAQVIGLQISFTVNAEQQHLFYSGWLLSLGDDSLLWITAGHVIDYIAKIRGTRDVVVHVSRWIDAYPKREAGSIPFALEELRVLSGTKQNVDVGAAEISGIAAKGLLANKLLRPIDVRKAKSTGKSKCVGYYVVGFPAERVLVGKRRIAKDRTECILQTDAIALPVKPMPDFTPTSDMAPPEDMHLWWGEILPQIGSTEAHLGSVRGMSGGPVVSIQQDTAGRFSHRFIGVQSIWFPKRRIIGAVPMDRLVGCFRELAADR